MFIPQTLVQAVLSTIPNGQFYTVNFEKKDGSQRTMVCQNGVAKHVKGTGTSPSKANPDLQTVYEQNKQGYRSFNTKQVFYIKTQGIEIRPSAVAV